MIDFTDFLTEYADDEHYADGSIGNIINKEVPKELNKDAIYILQIKNSSNINYEVETSVLTNWRSYFKKLFPNNWKREVYDLGLLLIGEDINQFKFALEEITKSVSKSKGILIVVGGDQSYSYNLFKSLDKKFKNVSTIDKSLDLGDPTDEINPANWVSKMIINPELKLLNYYNFGSQIPFNQIENEDILEQLNFYNMGLGKLSGNLKKTEPYLRDTHLLSIDMSAIQRSLFKSANNTVNGLNAREVCGISRYAGLSLGLNIVHLSNFNVTNYNLENELIAEMIWYFIDAKNNLKKDGDINSYRVQLEDQEIVFLKSNQSERWWIEIMIDGTIQRIPCDEEDYYECLKGEIPDRWSKFFKRFF